MKSIKRASKGVGESNKTGELVARAAGTREEYSEGSLWLEAEHYLGKFKPVGHTLMQFIEEEGRCVAVLVWGACAYRLKDREQWIGWDSVTQSRRRNLIVNNVRFLVLEAARRPNLASQCLGAAHRVLVSQWKERFGYEPLLAETFTDPELHTGTCYKASGWIELGLTEGNQRHRHDFYQPNERPKRLWLKPLRADTRERLLAPELAPEHRAGQTVGAGARSPLKQSELLSLWQALRELPDPRAKKGRRYPLAGLLSVIALGLLTGCRHLSEIVRCGTRLSPAQRALLGFLPSSGEQSRGCKFYPIGTYNLYRTLLQEINLEQLGELLTRWLGTTRGSLPATLAMDGKTIRKNLGLIVTLLDTETGMPVAVAATTENGGELLCARQLLTSPGVDLTHAIVVADALHTNAENAHLIVQEKGGDYIASVKGNQPELLKNAGQQLKGAPFFSNRRKPAAALSMSAPSVTAQPSPTR